MSGVLSALVAASGNYYSVGVVDIGGGAYGFQTGAGTISSTALKTSAIIVCRTLGGGNQFQLALDTAEVSSFIKHVAIQQSDGSRVVLLASAATFTNPGGTQSLWSWSGTPVWNAAATRTVEIGS